VADKLPFVLQRIHDDAVSKKDPPLSSIRFALWLIRSTNKSHIAHGLQILQELLSSSHRDDPLLSFAFAVGLMYHRDFSEASKLLLPLPSSSLQMWRSQRHQSFTDLRLSFGSLVFQARKVATNLLKRDPSPRNQILLDHIASTIRKGLT